MLVRRHADPAPEALIAQTGAEAVSAGGAASADWILEYVDGRLELRTPGMRRGRGLVVDFTRLDLRVGSGSLGFRQPLAKAIGRDHRTVVDATAGLGEDSMLLACLGFEVTAIERHPVVAALLADGLARVTDHEALAAVYRRPIEMHAGDARTCLPAIDPAPEVVYVDPMYPPKRKASALPKKEIQVLRRLVGADEDAEELVAVAMATARRRVVVKRPIHAEPLLDEPVACHAGKLARYDVYVPEVRRA